MEKTGQISKEQLQKEHGSYFRQVLEAQMYPVSEAASAQEATERHAKLEEIYNRIHSTIVPEEKEVKAAYPKDKKVQGLHMRTLYADAVLALSKVSYLQNGVIDGRSLELSDMSVETLPTPANVNWHTQVLAEWVDTAYQGKTVTAAPSVGYEKATATLQANIEYMQQPDAFTEPSFAGTPSDIHPQVLNTLIEAQQKLQDMGQYTPNVKQRA